jgi:hypothetical protein
MEKSESVMQQEKRCPSCKHGRHKQHQADFMSRVGQVTLCRCAACVPPTVYKPSVAEVEMAQ